MITDAQEPDMSPRTVVTAEDIRLFRTTLLSRRFPGMKDAKDDAIKQLILRERRQSGSIQKMGQKTHPKRDFAPLPPAREQPGSGILPFLPVNQAQAKEDVRRPDAESHIGVGSPFDLDRIDCARDAVSDLSKRGMAGPFMPTSPSQAREAIQVDYFLNPNDSIKPGDASMMGGRSGIHKEQYRELYLSRRGKSLML